jgi:hypothetical protein
LQYLAHCKQLFRRGDAAATLEFANARLAQIAPCSQPYPGPVQQGSSHPYLVWGQKSHRTSPSLLPSELEDHGYVPFPAQLSAPHVSVTIAPLEPLRRRVG